MLRAHCMEGFIVPATEAVVTTVVQKIVKKNEVNKENGGTGISFSK